MMLRKLGLSLPSARLRIKTVRLLGKTLDNRAFDTLEAVLKADPDPSVRLAALEEITHFGHVRTLSVMLDAVRTSTSSRVRQATVAGLWQGRNEWASAPEVLDTAVELLRDSDPEVAFDAGRLLALKSDRRCMSFLLNAMLQSPGRRRAEPRQGRVGPPGNHSPR